MLMTIKHLCNYFDNKYTLFDRIYYYFKVKRIATKIDWPLYMNKNKIICNGDVVIKGTRIKPETIYNYFFKLSKKEKDINKIVITINKSYPTINEKDIYLSIIYTVKKKGIKFIL